ncbi:hypothetical protein NTE_00461 [Candidatus Nitrososphaera evergladensis SR1]|uniref:Uncharacterized protein n=1 Tax=Candidatus Nitrososphaera evergladensis SR1 TaxID=1459636 RepID=A0A075MMP5_9ARCH|nr:hypothetical protein NTE_00461 [Candidatus Nitrososphaera evergladensis SR1]
MTAKREDAREISHCVLCGRPIAGNEFVETIDSMNYSFDTKTCIITFKKLHSVYGSEFMTDFVNQGFR